MGAVQQLVMVHGAATGALDPDDVSNLVLWLKAGAGVYSDAGTTPAVNNDSVAQWNDQSGAGHHATTIGTVADPLLRNSQINGHPAIEWVSSDVLNVADHADLELDTDSTVFVVAKVTSLADGRTLLSKDNDGSAGAYFFGVTVTAGKPTLDRPFVEAGVAATTGVGTTNYNVLTVKVSGTTVSHFLNGAANGTDTLATGTATSTPLHIGRYGSASPTNPLIGFIAEIVIYNRALTAGEVEGIEAGLGTKYAISIS